MEDGKRELKKYCDFYSVWAENEVVEKVDELLKCKSRKYKGPGFTGTFYQESEDKRSGMEGYGLYVKDSDTYKIFRLGCFSNKKLTRGLHFE